MNDWANFREWSQHPDADAVIADLVRDNSLTPGLDWYRANIPPQALIDPPLELPQVQAPAMGLWSTGDFALTRGADDRIGEILRTTRSATSGSRGRGTGCSGRRPRR